MNKKISSALISVFYKDGLEPVVQQLKQLGATIYSTGGTQAFIQSLEMEVVPVESLTTYPSILGGRVKTLHPSVFGGILGRRENETDVQEMQQYNIPALDLVIVDLYPFRETAANTTEEKAIIEKIDIGGPSMIRAAAKNFKDVTVIASKNDYALLVKLLQQQEGEITLEQRRAFAAKAFRVVADYDIDITNYFNKDTPLTVYSPEQKKALRYGENPHQHAAFFGNLDAWFTQLHGKEISYNNLVDINAAIELIKEAHPRPFPKGRETEAQPMPADETEINSDIQTGEVSAVDSLPFGKGRGWAGRLGWSPVFAIIKHTNVCGIASRQNVSEAWKAALAGDPESAFGGVLVCNSEIDETTAQAINEFFFEVLLATHFSEAALAVLKSKKNRILLELHEANFTTSTSKTVLNGLLVQDMDTGNFETWNEVGGRPCTGAEKEDAVFANLVCKHLKSNAIALVKNGQLIGKGCGQTSRIDALRQALEKAAQFNFDVSGSVLASDAFFPFDDCVKMGHEAGITVFIQPGGSVRDKDSIAYCTEHNLAMVFTGLRHFKH